MTWLTTGRLQLLTDFSNDDHSDSNFPVLYVNGTGGRLPKIVIRRNNVMGTLFPNSWKFLLPMQSELAYERYIKPIHLYCYMLSTEEEFLTMEFVRSKRYAHKWHTVKWPQSQWDSVLSDCVCHSIRSINCIAAATTTANSGTFTCHCIAFVRLFSIRSILCVSAA